MDTYKCWKLNVEDISVYSAGCRDPPQLGLPPIEYDRRVSVCRKGRCDASRHLRCRPKYSIVGTSRDGANSKRFTCTVILRQEYLKQSCTTLLLCSKALRCHTRIVVYRVYYVAKHGDNLCMCSCMHSFAPRPKPTRRCSRYTVVP